MKNLSKMRTINNPNAIIYDDNCPMCQAYTLAFVTTGFLQQENRIPFSKIKDKIVPACTKKINVDWQRARHEIPVINKASGEVFYGIDALAEVLNQKIFFVKPVLKLKPIRWFFKQLYSLISYNRNIIVANHSPVIGEFNSSPDFSMRWRFLFIIVVIFLSTILLNDTVSGRENWTLIIIALGVIFIPVLLIISFATKTMKRNTTNIIAQVAIVTFIASFLLRTSLFLKNIFWLPQVVFYLLLLSSGVITCLQIVRRLRYLLTGNDR
jgi:predicted DCC family thiol-disulfide oxidoreductase YuxK